MPPDVKLRKTRSLQAIQKECDALKKNVDKFVADCQSDLKVAKRNIAEDKELYARCQEEKKTIDNLLHRARQMKHENEPISVESFKEKKLDEVKRLEKLKLSVEAIERQVTDRVDDKRDRSDTKKDVLKRKSAKANDDKQEHSTKDDDEEGAEEDSEEGEDEEMEDEQEIEDSAAIESDEEEEEDETVGDQDTDDDDDDDDEVDDMEDEEEEESDDEEEEEESDGEESDFGEETMRQFEAIVDFEGEQGGDLSFKAGDILTVISARSDGWLHAENSAGKRGLVPSTFLKFVSKNVHGNGEEGDTDDGLPDTARSGKVLWKKIRNSVKETCVADVLHALKAIPSGFRESTLAKLQQQDRYTLKNYLTPKLSPSNVAYRDLFFDPISNQIRSRTARIQRIVTIVSARQIPPPGAGIEVKSRHVRMALFDGSNVLSNVHTIRASSIDKDERTWNFCTKVTDTMQSLLCSDCFVRSNTSEGNIGILFELCITYVRTKTGQWGEFSCGWTHLPLFDEEPRPVANKTYDLYVNGGTPYEKGVEVDTGAGKKASTSRFRSILLGNRQPQLVIRLAGPTKDQKELLDTLPDVLVSSATYMRYFSFYRQMLMDALLRDRSDIQSTELVPDPVLAVFTEVVQHSDLMDVLRAQWAERLKTAKRAEKRGHEALLDLFRKVFLTVVYPLRFSASVPPPSAFLDPAAEQERRVEIDRLLALSKEKNVVAASLLSADTLHQPFNMAELAFNVVSPQCLQQAH